MANQLTATNRTEFGKGAARRIRRAGDVPAVLYGHGTDPVHLTLPGKETFLILRHVNVLLQISVDDGQPVMALPRQVQRHPITNFVEHVDLLIVRAGEKVNVEVPLTFIGEVERGAMVNYEINALSVLAPATDIPAEIEVSVEGMEIGDMLTAADIKLPEGVQLHDEPETLVVNVTPPPVAELETEEPVEDEEGIEGDEDTEDEE